eukprot:tig00000140_g8468.t1
MSTGPCSAEYPAELFELALGLGAAPSACKRPASVASPDTPAALLARGVPAERAQVILNEFQAASCVWRACAAFGSVQAYLAVHTSEGQLFSVDDFVLLDTFAECMGVCLAIEDAMGGDAGASCGEAEPVPSPLLDDTPSDPDRELSLCLELRSKNEQLRTAGEAGERAGPASSIARNLELLRELEARSEQLRVEHVEKTVALERRLQVEALLRGIASSIRTQLNLKDVLRATIGDIQRLFDCDSVLVSALKRAPGEQGAAPFSLLGSERELFFRYQKDRGLYETLGRELVAIPGCRYRLSRLFAGPCAARAEARWMRWIPDLDEGGPAADEHDASFAQLRESLIQREIKAIIVQPMEWDSKVIGYIAVCWNREREFSAHEVATFQAVTDQVGHAVGQDALLESLRLKNESLERALVRAELLMSITKEIRNTLEPQSVVESTARRLREAFQADSTDICMVDWTGKDKDEVEYVKYTRSTRDADGVRGAPPPPHAVAHGDGDGDGGPGADFAPAYGPGFLAALGPRIQAVLRSGGERAFAVSDLHAAQAWAGEEALPGTGGAADPEVVACLRRAGVRSGVLRASRGGGRVNGVVALLWREPGRELRGEDLQFFDDTVGVALAHAGLLQRARQAARAKADFLSVITHELRTPMQAVVGVTDLLLDDAPRPQQREYIDLIRVSAQALLDLVGEVLEASALERGGQIRVDAAPCDLRACAEAALDMLWPVAAQKEIALQLVFRGAVPRFLASDRGRIRQVMVNLIGNSVKFSERGRVCVEVEAAAAPGPDGKTAFRICVTDSGCGISAADQRRLFHFFTQLDSSKSRRHQGTGLGLYISLQIARALEGDIQVVSTPGTGSTFAFTFRAAALPEGDAALPALRAACLAEGHAALRGAALVLASDEAAWLETAGEDAARWGARVVRAGTPEQALRVTAGAAREAADGGPPLAACVLFMPSCVPPAELPALADRLLAAMSAPGGGGGGGGGGGPVLVLPRPALPLEGRPPRGAAPGPRPRLPLSERALHDALLSGLRAADPAPAPAPPPPQPPPPAAAPAAAPSAPRGSEGGGMRILFAEDTPARPSSLRKTDFPFSNAS